MDKFDDLVEGKDYILLDGMEMESLLREERESRLQNEANDQEISFACGVGDSVIDYLITSGLVKDEVLYTKRYLENPDDDIPDNEDPSGFTDRGRELFEFVYNLVRGD